MLEKYFGYNTIQDELSVLDSLLEHTRIDEEELHLLSDIFTHLFKHSPEDIYSQYSKILKIRNDSGRIFENVAEDIIQADFNHQKQYDLLRLYQRIEAISDGISATAKRTVIFVRVGGVYPPELVGATQSMINAVVKLHEEFKNALHNYQNNKKVVLKTINKVAELERQVDDHRIEAIEQLYKLGNDKKLLIGNFRGIENILDRLETLADSIEDAATSLEWLLI
jgi:uncharacterized protein Yka (UPF0111/DUF47 family)